jgi:membrane protein implicated in regulation of membrane protease activity
MQMVLSAIDIQVIVVVVWVVAFFLAVLIEVLEPQLVSLWFAGGALVALVAAILNVNVVVQVVLFLASTIVLLILTRPFVKRVTNKVPVPTNADALIGKEILVEKGFSLKSQGVGLHADIRWKLVTDQDISFDQGEFAIVKAIKGNKLFVTKKEAR